jgi:hypothetical protein
MIEKLETEGCSKDACIIAYTHVKTFIQLEKTHVFGLDLAYAFSIFTSTPWHFSESPLHTAW